MDNFKFEIKEKLGVLSTSKSGWSKELNLVSWNDKEAKYDIREWSPDHESLSKGLTFTKEELVNLKNILNDLFETSIDESSSVRNVPKLDNLNSQSNNESNIVNEDDITLSESPKFDAKNEMDLAKKLKEDENVFIEEDDDDKDLWELKDEDEIAVDEFDESEEVTTSQDDIFEGVSLDDPVRMYLKEIGQYSLLSIEREKRLAKEKQEAQVLLRKKKLNEQLPIDDARVIKLTKNELEIVKRGELAQNTLINCNLRLVVSIAKRYIGHGLSLLDLIQEGNLGLIRGIEKFDYKMGFKLSTYVTWWIKQAIIRALADKGKSIRIPVHMVETINRLNKERKKLTTELGYEPDTKQLAKAMKMSVEKVEEIIQITNELISLDTLISTGGLENERIQLYMECKNEFENELHRNPTISEIADRMNTDEDEIYKIEYEIEQDQDGLIRRIDNILDSNAIDPEKNAERIMLKEKIQGLLMGLKERERKVLILRFGIDDDHPRTLEEVGKELKVTRERIRQIEDKALRKLKIRARSLQDIIK